MSNTKCQSCGLVNFSDALACKRCGAQLDAASGGDTVERDAHYEASDEFAETRPRSLVRRVAAGVGAAFLLLVGFYVSLLATSTPATLDQKQLVKRAVDIIERRGFTRDAFLLRHLAAYRTTDHWWNTYTGHADAYAATNFPFEVVTLYPDFFKAATDDTERAAILLHEARHLSGFGEEKAFAGVWRDKERLGWTQEKYGTTRVWRNVTEFTLRYAPRLFPCGPQSQPDCTQ